MDDDGNVVRLRGLPWSSSPDDIYSFFGDSVNIVPDGVHFTFSREGRPSGECFVEVVSEQDVEKALERHKDHMGQRYIEVFHSKRSEMDWVVKRSGRNQPESKEAVLRLRGLPFGCSKEEIMQFFSGLEIVPNGIMLQEDRQGRATGEAYVQFASSDCAEKALLKHKERIGHRYIEIFKSSLNEASACIGYGPKPRSLLAPSMGGAMRPGPYNRNVAMGGGVGMGVGYGRGRGGRNLKGFYEDDYEDDMGFAGNMGGGGGGRMGMGNMAGVQEYRQDFSSKVQEYRQDFSSKAGMGMNRRGNMRQPRIMGGGAGRMPSGGGPNMGMGGGGLQAMGGSYVSKTGHSVHMRGLPFQADEQDVADFFSPLVPVKVEFDYNAAGKPTGEANVDFSTHAEAKEAMKKHKANMQHRYIELFLNSVPGNRSDGMYPGDGFDGDEDMDMMGGMQGNMMMRKGNMGGGFGGNMKMEGGFNSMGGGMGMRNRMNNPNYTAF
ncbi:heterogeneous nuclear ribonucleoprotein F-like isoform X2 [Dreissena polymorpha]|uniref:heterogeneous nuclear ribonucleoprotein F-like isoform X2 n=1 Tax=Dreissena polymorpha TaxID=45954 RepID=UPI0022656BBA|nr:heterogeneous nuclear ribonucleoprotein F-like isoform X2 [Dreissena polymorpha]